jgi:hypothetical protein
MTKKILLSILAIVLSGCVIISAVLIFSAVKIKQSNTSATAVVATTAIVTPTPTEMVKATDGQLSNSESAQMDQIQEEVMSYRGLKLTQPLSRSLLTTDELKDHVINDFFADYTDEDAKDDSEELSAFGLLPADFNLHDFYVKLYSEQIAGYYDNKTKKMYVVSDEGFNGTERMTYAHEFTHVLQDQTYDLENGLKDNEEYCKNETEYCAAITALIEGDATLSEQYWFYKYSTDLDQKQVQEFQNSYTSPVYDSAPAYMKEDFLFPYQYGLEFVNELYKQNKWQAIDDAFKNPPVSTEQIMHPEKYPDETPVVVKLPDLTSKLGSGWREVDNNVMGEWYTYLMLAKGRDPKFQLDDQTAKDAAAGWGGDRYAYFRNDSTNQFVMVWVSQWDTQTDSDEYWQASRTYGNDRWGTAQKDSKNVISWNSDTDGIITMEKSGDSVLWVMSPSTDVQAEVLDSVQFGN